MRLSINGYVFGGPHDPVFISEFDPQAYESTGETRRNPLRSGASLTPSYLGAGKLLITAHTNAKDHNGAKTAARKLASVWATEKVRQSTTPVLLGFTDDDVTGPDTEWVYFVGKPDDFLSTKGTAVAKQGRIDFTMSFTVTEPVQYGAQQSTTIQAGSRSTGGLTSPLVSPLTSTATGEERSNIVTNNGDAASPLTVIFSGPCRDPQVRIGSGRVVKLNMNLAHDVKIKLDPLAGTVTRVRDGVSFAGNLDVKSRLKSLMIQPGRHDVSYSAVDPTGQASVELQWRDGHNYT